MSTIKGLLIGAIIVCAAAGSAMAEETGGKPGEHKFVKAAGYYGECKATSSEEFAKIKPQLKAFTDMEVMAETLSDPERFFKLVNVVNDPRTIHVMSKCATEPVMWDTWMRGTTDVAKMASAMTKLMNPAAMMKWMMAPANPKVWKLAASQFDAEKYNRWAVAAANPTFYSPVTSLFDPNWYDARIKWVANPKSYEPAYRLFGSPVNLSLLTKK